ncbi:MAG: hypothetical protein QOF02_2444 [Blastocatellia bacterium]|jgi:hypothetical protein|nr:hypothetical protein [Blastocatellia bacterium]
MTRRKNLTIAALVFLLLATPTLFAQERRVLRKAKFMPQNKNVLLIGKSEADPDKIVLFQTRLRINTDGAPNSYHPFDLRGSVKAINNICNAISVRLLSNNQKQPCAKAIEVFQNFRDNNWKVPAGYKITWSNVLAARVEGDRKIPCVFKSGEFKGYLGSLTRLENDLPAQERNECEANNQLDQRFIPALVLVSGVTPVSEFGAGVGDLLVALNPKTGVVSAAIVGDTGPDDNLGEGSVALNMMLLGVLKQPANYTEAKALDTGSQEILVAIIPRSRLFQTKKPYTKESIQERVNNWQRAAGFDTPEKFIELIKHFQAELP